MQDAAAYTTDAVGAPLSAPSSLHGDCIAVSFNQAVATVGGLAFFSFQVPPNASTKLYFPTTSTIFLTGFTSIRSSEYELGRWRTGSGGVEGGRRPDGSEVGKGVSK